MIRLILCLGTLLFCHSWTPLSYEENEQRLESCGVRENPTTDPPRIWARDAPWLVDVGWVNDDGADIRTGAGVIISPRHVLTGISSFVKVAKSSGNKRIVKYHCLENSFKKSYSHNIYAIEHPCEDGTETSTNKTCKPGQNIRYDILEGKVFGDCEHPEEVFVVLELNGTFKNAPICLPGNRTLNDKDEVMLHASSRFRDENPMDLKKTATITKTTENGVDLVNANGLRDMNWDRGSTLVQVFQGVKNVDEFVAVGTTWEVDRKLNLYVPIAPIQDELCEIVSICSNSSEILEKLEDLKLSDSENMARLEKCGVSRNSSQPHPWTVWIATWIVTTPPQHGLDFTGVFISQRHVLTDSQIFQDIDVASKFKNTNGFISIDFPHKKLGLKVEMRYPECIGKNCSFLPVQPVKIYLERGKDSFVILEFNQSLPITPICMPGIEYTYEDYRVELLGYGAIPTARKRVTVQSDQNNTRSIKIPPIHSIENHHNLLAMQGVLKHGDLLEESGRSMIVGYSKTNDTFYSYFTRIRNSQKMICKMSGICMESSEIRRGRVDGIVKKLVEEARIKKKKVLVGETVVFEDPKDGEDETGEKEEEEEERGEKKKRKKVADRQELGIIGVFALIWGLWVMF